VDELVPIPSHNDERRAAMDVIARFGVPAYLRRARRVEDSWAELLDRLRIDRRTLLAGVRLHLRLLLDAAGHLDALRPVVTDERIELLRSWAVEFGLAERPPTGAGPRRLRRAVRELVASVARFNRKWSAHVADTDLSEVNAERDGYNRWYLLEKECAVGVIRASQGFRPLPPATTADVQAALPPLPEIRVADSM
jgi:hypothetical protein